MNWYKTSLDQKYIQPYDPIERAQRAVADPMSKKPSPPSISYDELLQLHISPEEVRQYRELDKLVEKAYQLQNYDVAEMLEERLAILEEELSDRIEAVRSEGYSVEGQGEDVKEEASLEELLASIYADYVSGRGPYTKEELIGHMRNNIIMFGGKPLSDEQVLDAAKDAYLRRQKLRKRHKGSMRHELV